MRQGQGAKRSGMRCCNWSIAPGTMKRAAGLSILWEDYSPTLGDCTTSSAMSRSGFRTGEAIIEAAPGGPIPETFVFIVVETGQTEHKLPAPSIGVTASPENDTTMSASAWFFLRKGLSFFHDFGGKRGLHGCFTKERFGTSAFEGSVNKAAPEFAAAPLCPKNCKARSIRVKSMSR